MSNSDVHLEAQIPGLDAESGGSNEPSLGEAKLREKLPPQSGRFVHVVVADPFGGETDPVATIEKNMPVRKRAEAIDPLFSSCCTTLAVRFGELWSFLSSRPEEFLAMSRRDQAHVRHYLGYLTRWILFALQYDCEIQCPERLATGLREFQMMLEAVDEAQIPLQFRAKESGRDDFMKLLLKTDTEHTLFPRFLEIIKNAGVDLVEDCRPDRGMPVAYSEVVEYMCHLPGKLADEKVQQVVTALWETSLNRKEQRRFGRSVDSLEERWGGLNTSQLKRNFAEALARLQ